MNIGERIKSLRQQNGMTLQDVATRLNIQKPTVQRYESGIVKNIPNDKLEMLAKIFNVSPAYIMGWEEQNNIFGSRLRKLREDQGLTQQDIADIVHATNKAVSTWENGIKVPRQPKLIILAEYFGVTTDYLLGCDKHNTHFGSKLREVRKEKHLTLEQLAQMYNDRFNGELNKGTLSKYENGKQEPLSSVIANLAMLLNVSVDYLMGCENEEHDNCFSSRLRIAMEQANISQAELCEKTKIPKSALSQYLSGNFKPRQPRSGILAKALNVSEAWLMGYENTGNAFSDNLRRLLNGEELKTRDTEETSPKEEMLKLFDGLNTEGQKLAMKQMAFFASLPEFKKGSDNE